MGIVSTDQANIDAHMSILCSIWLLVSILGAGPEMFKNLGKSGQYFRLLIKFSSSPFIKVFTWVLPVASVASQCLNQEVTGLQSCVGECFLSFQRDTAISADLGKLALPLNYPPGKTGPDIGHHLSDQSVLEKCQQCNILFSAEQLPRGEYLSFSTSPVSKSGGNPKIGSKR